MLHPQPKSHTDRDCQCIVRSSLTGNRVLYVSDSIMGCEHFNDGINPSFLCSFLHCMRYRQRLTSTSRLLKIPVFDGWTFLVLTSAHQRSLFVLSSQYSPPPLSRIRNGYISKRTCYTTRILGYRRRPFTPPLSAARLCMNCTPTL